MVICTLPSKTLRRLPPFAYSQEVIISHWFGMERRGRGEEEEPTLVVRLSSQHSISLQHAKTRPVYSDTGFAFPCGDVTSCHLPRLWLTFDCDRGEGPYVLYVRHPPGAIFGSHLTSSSCFSALFATEDAVAGRM